MFKRFCVTMWISATLAGCSAAVEPSIGLRAHSPMVNNFGDRIGNTLYTQ